MALSSGPEIFEVFSVFSSKRRFFDVLDRPPRKCHFFCYDSFFYELLSEVVRAFI